MPEEKKKVYELDFGDQNLLSEDAQEIANEIISQLRDGKEGEEFEYRITLHLMTQQEIDELPEVGN